MVTNYYPNGKVLSRVNYDKGFKTDDHWQEFYDNGKLMSEVKVVKDRKEGPAKEYYSDGKLESEGTFADGKRQGIFKSYDQDGHRVQENEYKDDLIRYHREYNPKGQLLTEQIYYYPS